MDGPAFTAPDKASAQQLAVSTGSRIEVTSERTEYAQLFAEPTGRFTAESAVVPQRVHRADGSWADVDLNVESGDDGLIRPRVSVADVRFSGGGSGPLVTLVRAGRSFTLSWPLGALPKPALSGDSATYAEVLPGVDLVMRATRDGFSHVLAVKTAAAAADPGVKEITFGLGGSAQVRRGKDGSLAALADGTVIASAPAPAMWDSSPTAAVPAVKSLRAAAESGADGAGTSTVPSTAAAPADTARTAAVATALAPNGGLVLRPDAALLATATFPVYIDPAWSTGKTRWAYSTNNNSNNTDTSRARVGKDPSSGVVYRSYFEFPVTGIKNKFVYDAYVQMKVGHTYSCTSTPNTIFTSSPISGTPRTPWKSTGWYLKMLAQVSSHANEGSGCADSPQPDVTINFNTDAVKTVVQKAAKDGAATMTFVISAVDSTVAGESTQDRWKKYYPDNAKLIADVDAYPGTPTEYYVNGVRCQSATLRIGTTALKFSAKMPDADTTQTIKATWEWERLSGSSWVKMPAIPTSNAAANKTADSKVITDAVNGTTYRYHVQGTDPAPYSRSGYFSNWCTFTIDTADPPVSGEVTASGPGRPTQFKIKSEAPDLSKFRYGWNSAIIDLAPAGAETVGGVTYKYATVTLTPPKYGLNTLYLQAIDATGNVGDGSITFSADRASPAVARWGLETYSGVTATDAVADQQKALAGDTPLEPHGIGWTDKQHLVGGTNAAFAGNGYLNTATTLIDTTQSFAVATWVRLERTDVFQNLVAQDGQNTTNFQLQYRNDSVDGDSTADKSFCLTMRTADVAASASGVSVCAVNSAVAGRWIHVAAGYDAAEHKMRIWIDGVLKSEAAAPATAWVSAGPLRIGNRMLSPATYTDYLYGSVADVQVFDRMLVQEDLTGDDTDPADAVEGERGMLNPIEVARWDFDDAVLCYDPSYAATCEEPDNNTGFGQRLQFTQGVDVVGGSNGSYGMFDNRQIYWDDPTDPFYGTSTQEYGTSQRNAGDLATPDWQDTPVLNVDQSFTVAVRVHVDSIDAAMTAMTAIAAKGTKQSGFYLGIRKSTVGGVTAQRFEVMVPSADSDVGETYTHVIAPEALVEDDAGSWHELTVAYDAGNRKLTLYVNGTRQNSGEQVAIWHAAGPLTVGRSWATPDNAAGIYTDQWYGGIDDVRVFQGAMTDAQVAALNAAMES